MRILVASGFEASSLKAHAINTVKMAQGFARLGHQVTIVCRRSPEGKVAIAKLAKIYGITEPLRWIQLPNRIFGYQIDKHWRFGLFALPVALGMRPDLIYARSYVFPWWSSKFGLPTVAECHAHVGCNKEHFLKLVEATHHRTFYLWVTISHRLVDYYQSLGVPEKKPLVLADAVDLHLFQRRNPLPPSPYPANSTNVAYVGHLYDYKGIPTILEAAALLPDVCFHLVGGLPEDIERQKKRAQDLNLNNVTFHGLLPQVEVPKFLWHADALLLPPSQHHPSAAWTSPVKLGEYLASGTPTIASDIIALRDWLTDREVEFFRPDDAQALAEAIQHLLRDRNRAEQLCLAGLQKAQSLSYEQRAKTILDTCRSLSD
jgi:glycosyltransferase involved in cell wall biosynthesis